MLLEICANSYRSAIQAENSGANRIELCSELAVGGITPSFGLIKKTTESLKIPVFVLIRPRSGNFTYSHDEFDIMKSDVLQCKSMGCSGIVSGVLNEDNTVDIERTKILIELAKPLPFTFHRAFDWVENPVEALGQLMDLGVDRVLTSGQETAANKGLGLLKELKEKAGNKIGILPGGGINAENALLFKDAGFNEIHCSATTIKQVIETPKISMHSASFFDERTISFSDETRIANIIKAIS
ncbi:copper homeostasis protein CutC [Hwangdonia lutea]|uniref:PF03932 family protein CutC n=1 Tax=Hwangdonia lutea TaxID=3075823 RepID=A0AA97HQ83_9FLAO|nr:copper homeostasis protein CutC [Hwangdonia sp. SCSIO 19198]WOD42063.1 copper homeostasis protein CutC [Hwangdonia sp. SCSIO 19198]